MVLRIPFEADFDLPLIKLRLVGVANQKKDKNLFIHDRDLSFCNSIINGHPREKCKNCKSIQKCALIRLMNLIVMRAENV